MKKHIYEILIINLLCLLFLMMGVLLSQNEIYGDEWYIVGSVDGLFGSNNISLLTHCSNFIITGIIYLFSLTGIRLNWLLIIMLFFEYITFLLVFKSLIARFGLKRGLFFSILFLIIIFPYLFRMHGFTNSGAFLCAGGAFGIFDCIKNRRRIYNYILGILLVIIGFSIRTDVILITIFLFGIFWLIDILPLVVKEINNKSRLLQVLSHYIAAFCVCFFIMLTIFFLQNMMMEKTNPNFYEWNALRSQVDNYTIPVYKQNKNEYEKLGISNVDYNLLLSLNNLDSEFFSLDKYNGIFELKNKINKSEKKNYSYLINLIIKSLKAFCCNSIIGIWVFL